MRAELLQLIDFDLPLDAVGSLRVTRVESGVGVSRPFDGDTLFIAVAGPLDDACRVSTAIQDAAGTIPIVLVVPEASEDANRRALDAGAQFAVTPSRLPALVREFEHAANPATIARIEDLRATFDLAPIGIVLTNLYGRWIYANARLCEQLGFAREEMRQKKFYATSHPDDEYGTRLRFANLVSGLVPKNHGEKRYLRKDGSTMCASVTTVMPRQTNGDIDFFVTTIEDITGKRAAEERNRFQAALLGCAEEAIIACDPDGGVLYWNNSAERMYGWKSEEAVGRPILELVPATGRGSHPTELIAGPLQGGTVRGEYEVSARDGRVFPVTATASPIYDGGKLVGIVGISRDVSARRRDEQRLSRRYSQLQATTDLGRLALRGVSLDELFRFASTCLSAVLDASLVEISKCRGDRMLLAGGAGWAEGEIGAFSYSATDAFAASVLAVEEPVVADTVFADRGIVSSMAMRIWGNHDAVWGLVAVHSRKPLNFDVDDSLFLISIANVLGDAIHRRMMECETQTRAEQQSAIADLSRFAMAAATDQEIIDAACSVVGALLRVEHPIYLAYVEERRHLIVAGGKPWLPPEERSPGMLDDESLAAYVMIHGEPVVVNDYANEARFNAGRLFVNYGIVSGLAAPVKGSKRTLGVLGAHALSMRQFTSSDATFVQAVGNVVAQAIERNAVRRDLAASEARHRAVVEGASEAIFATDVDGLVTSLNPAFETMTGWYREEWIGKPLRDLVLISDRERFDAAFARLLRGELIEGAEMNIRGTRRGIVVEANAFVRGEGAAREIYGFARDVTAARASEQERRALLSELQLILESTEEGIYATDSEGRCTLLNRASTRMLGYTVNEMFGMRIHEIVHGRRADGSPYPADACPVINVLRTGVAHRGTDETFWTADGKPVIVDYSASPIISDGVVRGVVVTFTDITERRKLEAQLEQAKRLGGLGRLAATVAHEFNNVLMSISPFAEILRRETTTPRGSSACEQILKAVRRGKGITEEILRFTHPSEPKLTSIAVSDWLDGFAVEARSIVGPRFDVEVRVEPGLPDILADAHQLYQAFSNLALNARDAMADGGTIEIGACREPRSTVFSFGVVYNAEQFVHFWVRDTGTGMSSDVLQHIFEPLFTTKRNGTGLGLAVTHQVVQRHGGELFVESSLGRGTTFHLFFPIAHSLAAARREKVVTEGARFHDILIVEDEPMVAEGIATVLRLGGTRVTVVGTGTAAIERITESVPDAMILDVGLPDMDGRLVYERIQGIAPKLPVVFSTGHEPGHAMANTAWLMKPYELDVLLSALDTLAAENA